MANTKKKNNKKEIQESESFDYKGLLVLIFSGVLIFFSIAKYGAFGIFTHNLLNYLLGPFYLVLLLSLFVINFDHVFLKKICKLNVWFTIGIVILNVTFFVLGAYIQNAGVIESAEILVILKSFTSLMSAEASFGGGLLGGLLLLLSNMAFSIKGSLIMIVVLFVVSLILIIPLGVYRSFINTMKEKANDAYEKGKQVKEERRKKQEENERIEEERKLALASEMNATYAEEVVPEDKHFEQVEIEEVTNTSDFSNTYFLNADEKNDKAKTKKEGTSKVTKTVRKSNSTYKLPPLTLLTKSTGKPSVTNKRAADIKGAKLIEILRDFDIEAELINTHIGPSVTKFEVKPEAKVKVNRINNIQDNIKMELQATDIRIEAPIPGRNAVGIEIPNAETVMVRMSELMNDIPAKYQNSKLAFTLGKDLMGEAVYCELNKMPHLLIAGATGSGKSVCINTIITSYLLRSDPSDLKMVLIDPKKVEFSPYHDIPHLLWPVITDTNVAALMLKKAVVIMEERYDLFADAGVRDIASYNNYVDEYNQSIGKEETPKPRLPYIVIIIDELADLMSVAKKDVELSIQRLTQLSRACGMHMIVATQRPSTDVITGLIKSNIPSRISFAVSSSIDSRTILDSVGAEKLLGNGDMLYMPQGETAPIRIQGAFVTDKEIKNITDYVKSEAQPEYDDSYFELMRSNEQGAFAYTDQGNNNKDPLYDEVVEFVREQQKASTSLLQRKFGIGYNRSARIIDQLEDNNIIGPANGSKPREVYLKKEGS